MAGIPFVELAARGLRMPNRYQFTEAPPEDALAALRSAGKRPLRARNAFNIAAVRYIAERTDLLPVGMLIGSFSLMTKLIADPITPVDMAGSGVSAAADSGVRFVERCLELALATVLRSAEAQIGSECDVLHVRDSAETIRRKVDAMLTATE